MIFVEGLLFILLLVVGGICAYYDTKLGKVPNRIVGTGIVIAVCIQLIYNILFVQKFTLHWLLVLFLSCTISIAMYYADLWGAGDAKLFIFCYICTPSRLFDVDSLSFVVTPYIFIFIPAMLWLFIDSFRRYINKEKKYRPATSFKKSIKNWSVALLNSVALHGLLAVLFPRLLVENELFCAVIIIVYAYITNTFMPLRSKISMILHGVVIVICWGFGKLYISFNNWHDYLVILFVLAVQNWASLYNYREIETTSVMPGMVLDANTVIKFQRSRVKGLPQDFSERMRARITNDEAEAVRRWAASKQGEPTITIVRKIPFALFVLLGFVLWMVCLITRWI